MAIIVPSRRVWTRQPPGPVGVDRENPLSQGLAFAWNASGRREVHRGLMPDTDNTTAIVSSVGAARQCALSQTNIEWNREAILTSDGAGTGDFTVAVFAKAAAYNALSEHLFAQKNDAAGWPFSQMALLAHSDAAGSASSGGFACFTFSGTTHSATVAEGVSVGKWKLYGGRRSSTTITAFAGLSAASNTGVVREIANGTRRTAIGSRGNGTTDSYRGEVAFAAAWNRALSDAEWADLCANPWQLFAPQSSPILYSLPAAVSGGIPVLSLPGVQSITATSAVPKVTVTFS